MTPEEIKELVAGILADQKSEIMADVTKANQGLAASLTRELKKSLEGIQKQPEEQTEDNPEKLTMKALQAQLAALQQEREADKAKAFRAERDSAVSRLVASHELNNPGTVQKLFLTEYADRIKAEGNQWFVDGGEGAVKPLDRAFQDYLKSDEGSYFLKPSGVNGSGAKETKAPPVNQQSSKPGSLGGQMAAALLAE